VPLLDQIADVGLDLRFTEDVGWLVIVLGQPLHRCQIRLLGAQGHAAQDQIVVHALT
jgi:hypothetical protein